MKAEQVLISFRRLPETYRKRQKCARAISDDCRSFKLRSWAMFGFLNFNIFIFFSGGGARFNNLNLELGHCSSFLEVMYFIY